MRVIRVEGRDGMGIYRSKDGGGGKLERMWDWQDRSIQPMPHEDIHAMRKRARAGDDGWDWQERSPWIKRLNYGFASVDQLLGWIARNDEAFWEDVEGAQHLRFVEYEVPDRVVLKGDAQVAFNKLVARIVREVPPSEFKKEVYGL